MHRCLEVADIFHYILQFVVLVLWDDVNPYEGHHMCFDANPILAALARTCRAFSEPALDRLWQNQLNLYPLVRTFPPDAVEETIEWQPRVRRVRYMVRLKSLRM